MIVEAKTLVAYNPMTIAKYANRELNQLNVFYKSFTKGLPIPKEAFVKLLDKPRKDSKCWRVFKFVSFKSFWN